jgi:hypothetical protein
MPRRRPAASPVERTRKTDSIAGQRDSERVGKHPRRRPPTEPLRNSPDPALFGEDIKDYGICCVETFNTPDDRTGLIFCPDPANGYCPRDGGPKTGEWFTLNASFGNGEGCVCSRCEYRQYVRGECIVNGRVVRHWLVSPRSGRRVRMVRRRYLEDAIRETPNGPILRYGDRSAPFRENDQYRPNQAYGCDYYGWDFPGLLGLESGDIFSMDFHFEGRILETGSNRIMATRQWRVFHTGVFP